MEMCETYSRLFTMLEVKFGFPINNRGVDFLFFFIINFQIASRTYSISTSIVEDVIFSLSSNLVQHNVFSAFSRVIKF